MTLLLFSGVLALVAAAWVIRPILARRSALLVDLEPGKLLDAEDRKRVALSSLKEVEYDYFAGKLDEGDYHSMRSRLEVEALEAIRGATRLHPSAPVAGAHSCGFPNPGGSRFCAGCGARVA